MQSSPKSPKHKRINEILLAEEEVNFDDYNHRIISIFNILENYKADDLYTITTNTCSSDDIIQYIISTSANLTYKAYGLHTAKLCDSTFTVNLVSKIRSIILKTYPDEESSIDGIISFFKSPHGDFMLQKSFKCSSLNSKEYLANLLKASIRCKDDECNLKKFFSVDHVYLRKHAQSLSEIIPDINDKYSNVFGAIVGFDIQ